MSFHTAPLSRGGAPERIAAIQQRIQSFRSTSATAPTGAVEFASLLEAEQLKSTLGSAEAAGTTTDPTTGVLPTVLDLTAGGATGQAAPAVPAGESVVEAAKVYLGVPYLWGGTDPVKGFDCSGLIQAAYRDTGVEMPKWSRTQATMGVEVASIDDAIPGDVIAFGSPVDHVGIYVGDGKMLHAPRTGDVVKISSIKRDITHIRRIVTPGAVISPDSPVTAVAGRTVGTVPAAPTATVATSGADWSLSDAEAGFVPHFVAAGEAAGIDPTLLAAVARVESNFDPDATSPAGAQGLMQIMPATARHLGVDPWDPASAVHGAARYLRDALDRFGSTDLALAAYNAGPGAVATHGGIPPYPETQNYVRKVLAAWKERQ